VLQTCYRVELYALLSSDVDDARDELIDAFSQAHAIEREHLLEHLYLYRAEDVARHLFRVATGLESLVLGEGEILGQIRNADQSSHAAGTLGPVLALLFRTAISAGRRARAETTIGARPATASSLALALAEGALGDLRKKHVLVVGAGRIGAQTLDALTRRGAAEIAVANRTKSRALEVAARFGAAAYDLAELECALAATDLAITATSSESPVITAHILRRAMSERNGRPLVIVDLAVPGDVERNAGTLPGVRLFGVDDLRAGLDEATGSRLREVPKVEVIIEEEVARFGRRYCELDVEPLVSALRRQAEALRKRELDSALRDLGEIDPIVAERIEHLSRALVTKLLHDPTVRLRERARAGDADAVLESVRELFGISAAPSD
jgi:glutamyl-tRNA reductase